MALIGNRAARKRQRNPATAAAVRKEKTQPALRQLADAGGMAGTKVSILAKLVDRCPR